MYNQWCVSSDFSCLIKNVNEPSTNQQANVTDNNNDIDADAADDANYYSNFEKEKNSKQIAKRLKIWFAVVLVYSWKWIMIALKIKKFVGDKIRVILMERWEGGKVDWESSELRKRVKINWNANTLKTTEHRIKYFDVNKRLNCG